MLEMLRYTAAMKLPRTMEHEVGAFWEKHNAGCAPFANHSTSTVTSLTAPLCTILQHKAAALMSREGNTIWHAKHRCASESRHTEAVAGSRLESGLLPGPSLPGALQEGTLRTDRMFFCGCCERRKRRRV